MTNWRTWRLSEVTDSYDSLRVPVKEADRESGAFPYYGASGIVDHISKYIFDGEYLLISEDGENLRTRKTPIAFLATGKFWVNNHAHIIKGNERAVTHYLAYYIEASDISGYLSGSTMPKLTQGRLASIEVNLPDFQYQKKVVAILSAFDDKIELNRQMNRTLEQMARALFKSWFVDFDPVRAKMRGEMPEGMDAETAALFPDELVEVEGREVPLGWVVATVGDVCAAIFSGGTPDTRKPEYWNGEIPWFSSGETRNNYVIETEKKITLAGVENSSTRAAEPGDILIASAGQGFTRGQTSLSAIRTYINQSVVAIRANPSKISSEWLFLNLSSRYEEMRGISDGHSSRGSLTTKLLAQMVVIQPPKAISDSFDIAVLAAFKMQIQNLHESSQLAHLRDTLLPRLLSGEVDVEDWATAPKATSGGQT